MLTCTDLSLDVVVLFTIPEDQTAENRIKSNTKRIISSTRRYNPKMALINRPAQTTGGHSHAHP
jgi:hypothetical protein